MPLNSVLMLMILKYRVLMFRTHMFMILMLRLLIFIVLRPRIGSRGFGSGL